MLSFQLEVAQKTCNIVKGELSQRVLFERFVYQNSSHSDERISVKAYARVWPRRKVYQ